MRLEVVGFGPQAPVGAREQQIVVDESIQPRDVRVELRPAKLGLERDDFGVRRAYEHGIE